jgi:type IV pilus assembly protein PilA
MLYKLRQRAKDERGFTLIELLVVILIIGILAAIAIPSFINQKGKANDASAKELAHTAQVAIETFGTDNGTFVGATPAQLNTIESTIQVAPGGNNAYLDATTGTSNLATTAYWVTATSTSGTTYTIKRLAGGTIARSCAPVSTGGCNSAGTW